MFVSSQKGVCKQKNPFLCLVYCFADMILETSESLCIIDHHSDQVPSDTLRHERFNTYYPQSKCYADALKTARPEKPV